MTLFPHPSDLEYAFDTVIAAPNPAVDSYYRVDTVRVGEVHRTHDVLHTAGGKGINMARAVVSLGGRVLSLGIIGGSSGKLIENELLREGIASDNVITDRETRRCSTIVSDANPQTTVFLEAGGQITDAEGEAFCEKVLQHAADAPFVVLTGSLPPGLSLERYARLARQLVDRGAAVVVDAAGETLRAVGMSGPTVIKINLEEFYQAFAPDSVGGAWSWRTGKSVFDTLCARGVRLLIVTDGAHGAYILSRDGGQMHVHTAIRSWVSTAGAGDAFLAGLLVTSCRQAPLEEAIVRASAAAAANLQTVVCGDIPLDQYERFLHATTLQDVPKLPASKGLDG